MKAHLEKHIFDYLYFQVQILYEPVLESGVCSEEVDKYCYPTKEIFEGVLQQSLVSLHGNIGGLVDFKILRYNQVSGSALLRVEAAHADTLWSSLMFSSTCLEHRAQFAVDKLDNGTQESCIPRARRLCQQYLCVLLRQLHNECHSRGRCLIGGNRSFSRLILCLRESFASSRGKSLVIENCLAKLLLEKATYTLFLENRKCCFGNLWKTVACFALSVLEEPVFLSAIKDHILDLLLLCAHSPVSFILFSNLPHDVHMDDCAARAYPKFWFEVQVLKCLEKSGSLRTLSSSKALALKRAVWAFMNEKPCQGGECHEVLACLRCLEGVSKWASLSDILVSVKWMIDKPSTSVAVMYDCWRAISERFVNSPVVEYLPLTYQSLTGYAESFYRVMSPSLRKILYGLVTEHSLDVFLSNRRDFMDTVCNNIVNPVNIDSDKELVRLLSCLNFPKGGCVNRNFSVFNAFACALRDCVACQGLRKHCCLIEVANETHYAFTVSARPLRELFVTEDLTTSTCAYRGSRVIGNLIFIMFLFRIYYCLLERCSGRESDFVEVDIFGKIWRKFCAVYESIYEHESKEAEEA
eukprot:Nk52_evm11s1762 gene=Nk52_evmTU11s1762